MTAKSRVPPSDWGTTLSSARFHDRWGRASDSVCRMVCDGVRSVTTRLALTIGLFVRRSTEAT